MAEYRFTPKRRLAGAAILSMLLALEFAGAMHFMTSARPVAVLTSIVVGTILGFLAVIQYISDDFVRSDHDKRRPLAKELALMLPPTIFALAIALAFSRAGTGSGRNGLLGAAATIVVEGIWPLLIVTTATILVGTLSAWYLRKQLETVSK